MASEFLFAAGGALRPRGREATLDEAEADIVVQNVLGGAVWLPVVSYR